VLVEQGVDPWFAVPLAVAIGLVLLYLALQKLDQVRGFLTDAMRLFRAEIAAGADDVPDPVESAARLDTFGGPRGFVVKMLRPSARRVPRGEYVTFLLQMLHYLDSSDKACEDETLTLRNEVATALVDYGHFELAADELGRLADCFARLHGADHERVVRVKVRQTNLLAVVGSAGRSTSR
jgi:hypothetical protein